MAEDRKITNAAEAEVEYKYQSIYEITYNCLIKLLADGSAEC